MIENEDGSLTEEQVQTPAEDVAAPGAEATEENPETQEVKQDDPGEKKHPDWVQRRIDELTREKWNERREKEAALALVERLKSKEGDVKAEPDIDSLVEQRAKQLQAERDFNEACNQTYSKGKESFQDFDDAVKGHAMLGEVGSRREYLEAVAALENGAHVYHHLGKNLDEAAHVLSLPPVKMALELTKLSQKLSKAPPVSKAPPPIKPVAGAASREFDPETCSMEEYVKWRDEQDAKARGR